MFLNGYVILQAGVLGSGVSTVYSPVRGLILSLERWEIGGEINLRTVGREVEGTGG